MPVAGKTPSREKREITVTIEWQRERKMIASSDRYQHFLLCLYIYDLAKDVRDSGPYIEIFRCFYRVVDSTLGRLSYSHIFVDI